MEKKESQRQSEALYKLHSEVHKVLIDGIYRRMTIPQLNKELGLPQAIMLYARIEAKTGRTVDPTIPVDRYIDGELRYSKDIVIRGIKKSVIRITDYSGIKTAYVRKEDYNTGNIPKATMAEINEWERKLKEKHDV